MQFESAVFFENTHFSTVVFQKTLIFECGLHKSSHINICDRKKNEINSDRYN
jgi:hypothetical protein